MTGGMPSTAAVTAARQAGGYYAAQLADKLPELYQQAYQRYLQEYQRQMGLAGAYDDYDREAYSCYRDQLDQWNRDRSFAYEAARDSQAAGRQRNETAYSRYLDELDRYDRDRSFAYGAARDSQAAGGRGTKRSTAGIWTSWTSGTGTGALPIPGRGTRFPISGMTRNGPRSSGSTRMPRAGRPRNGSSTSGSTETS